MPVGVARQIDAYTVDGSSRADLQSAQDRFSGCERSKVKILTTERPLVSIVSSRLVRLLLLDELELPEDERLLTSVPGDFERPDLLGDLPRLEERHLLLDLVLLERVLSSIGFLGDLDLVFLLDFVLLERVLSNFGFPGDFDLVLEERVLPTGVLDFDLDLVLLLAFVLLERVLSNVGFLGDFDLVLEDSVLSNGFLDFDLDLDLVLEERVLPTAFLDFDLDLVLEDLVLSTGFLDFDLDRVLEDCVLPTGFLDFDLDLDLVVLEERFLSAGLLGDLLDDLSAGIFRAPVLLDD